MDFPILRYCTSPASCSGLFPSYTFIHDDTTQFSVFIPSPLPWSSRRSCNSVGSVFLLHANPLQWHWSDYDFGLRKQQGRTQRQAEVSQFIRPIFKLCLTPRKKIENIRIRSGHTGWMPERRVQTSMHVRNRSIIVTGSGIDGEGSGWARGKVARVCQRKAGTSDATIKEGFRTYGLRALPLSKLSPLQ